MDKPMSETDIRKLMGAKKVKIVAYNELPRIKNLDTLLKNKYLFVLYEYKPNYGHWTCLLKTVNKEGKDCIEFFDSYGAKPDRQLNGQPQSLKNKYGYDYPRVVELLLKSKYPIEYNNYKLQKYSEKVQTCGRWCMMRCLMDSMSIDTFVKEYKAAKQRLSRSAKSNKTLDDVVLETHNLMTKN